MKVGVPKEIVPGERRVALVPETVGRLVQSGIEVLIEAGAGEAAAFSDDLYRQAGAVVVSDAAVLYQEADVVLKVQKPGMNEATGVHETDLLKEGAVLIGLLQPLTNPDLIVRLAERKIISLSLDTIPRIARAQKMDALSSMSSIAGYKAVLIAASSLGKYLPMMMTAAGTVPPAKGLILGAGVAGLQAIATARRLGAVVAAYDVRPVVKEQVESLGAVFIEEQVSEEAEDAGGYARELSQDAQARERDLLGRHLKEADFVVTTALIPGRPAPLLITKEMVQEMKPGAVIVDIAAETGGNCELTIAGEEVVAHGVTIHGPINLPSSVPVHASQMYSRNISSLLLDMVADGELRIDFEDEVVKGCAITHDGAIVHGPTLALVRG